MIVRLRYSKLGKVRWISHRDVARVFERALRRSRLPVSYSAGFTPRPQLSFGLALPTGCESLAEYLDVLLDEELDTATLAGRLSPSLPCGIGVLAASPRDAGGGSLQEEVTSCTWEIEVPGTDPSALTRVVDGIMASASLPVERERKGKVATDDLRPSLISLEVRAMAPHEAGRLAAPDEGASASPGTVLVAELATRPRGVRPSELADVMGVCFGIARRTSQWIERDGSKFEPLDTRVAVFAGAEAGVS